MKKKQIIPICILTIVFIISCRKEKIQDVNNTSGSISNAEINLPIESISRGNLIWVDNARVTFKDKKTYADFTERHLYNSDSVFNIIRNLADYNRTRGSKPVNNNPADEEYLDLILNSKNEVRIGNDIVELNFKDSLTVIKTLSNTIVASYSFNSDFNYVDLDSEGNALRPMVGCNESGVGFISDPKTIVTTTAIGASVGGCNYWDSKYEYRLLYNKFGIYFTIVYKQSIVGINPVNPACGSSGTQSPYVINSTNAREFQIGSLKPRCRAWQNKGPGMGSQSASGPNWSKDRMYSSARALHKFHIRTFSDHPQINTSTMNSSNFTTNPNAVKLEIKKNM